MKLRALHRISLNYYRKHLIQLILLISGIALGVAAIAAIDLANSNASQSFRYSVRRLGGGATHSIYSVSGKINQKVYFDIRSHLENKDISPVIEKDVTIGGAPNRFYTVVGVDPFSDIQLREFFGNNGITLGSGSLGKLLTVKKSAVIPSGLIGDKPIIPGDIIPIVYDKEIIHLKVVGVLGSDNDKRESLSNYKIIVDISTAQEIFDYKGFISRIDLDLRKENHDMEIWIKSYLSSNYPDAYLIKNQSLLRENQKLTRAFGLNLEALSLITILVAFFLIYNTFNYSLVVRRPVFAVLRSLGVTSSQLFQLMLAEAIVIGLLGCIIGILFGIILGIISVDLVSNTYRSIYQIHTAVLTGVPAKSIIKSFLIGMVSIFTAVLIPALESMYIRPVNIARTSVMQSVFNRITPKLLIIGIIMFISGIYLNLGTDLSVGFNFLALFIVILGYTLTLPILMNVLGKLVYILQRNFLKRINLIAVKNYLESIDINFTATASLVIAVSVFLSMTVLIQSFRSTLTRWLDDTFRSDVFISSVSSENISGGIDFAVLGRIKTVEGINTIGYSRKIEIVTGKYGTINLLALSNHPPVHPQLINSFDERSYIVSDLGYRDVLVSESFYTNNKDKMINHIIQLPTNNGLLTFRIRGIFADFATQKGTLVLNYVAFSKYWNDNRLTSISFNFDKNIDSKAVLNDIENKLSGVNGYKITTNAGLKQAAYKIFDETFTITKAMRIIAFIVAFLGVLGALLCLELSRNRQIGILRSIGATIEDIKKIILVETLTVGLISGFLSIPLGVVMSYLLIKVINYKSFGWTIDFLLNPLHLIEAVLISVTAAIMAGIYPSHIFSKIKISELLKNE